MNLSHQTYQRTIHPIRFLKFSIGLNAIITANTVDSKSAKARSKWLELTLTLNEYLFVLLLFRKYKKKRDKSKHRSMINSCFFFVVFERSLGQTNAADLEKKVADDRKSWNRKSYLHNSCLMRYTACSYWTRLCLRSWKTMYECIRIGDLVGSFFGSSPDIDEK